MIKNIALIFSILLLSIFLIGSAYILKDGGICCRYELCKQMTSVCDIKGDSSYSHDGVELFSKKGEKIFFENFKEGDSIYVVDKIKGSAPSSWFYESMFPVKVFDMNGDEIVLLYAIASLNTTDADRVGFTVDLSSFVIELDGDKASVFQFEKDNPSGLKENSDYVQVTVTLKPKEVVKNTTIKVFYPNEKLSNIEDCSLVYPIVREISYTTEIGMASLDELFKELNDTDLQQGYFTSIPHGVKVLSLSIDNGVASVDFSKELEDGVGGSCMVSSIRAQIEETLMQFSTVDSVNISIEGESYDALQP